MFRPLGAVTNEFREAADHLGDAYFPYGFIKSISLDARRRLWAERGSAQTHAKDIILMSSSQQGHVSYLPWDSRFFKRDMYRLNFFWATSLDDRQTVLAELEKQLRKQRASYAVAFVPSEDGSALHTLGRSGWSVIETRLTYWRSGVRAFDPRRRFAVRFAHASDLLPLQETAVLARNRYDRFHGDSYFSGAERDALMREWVRASILDHFADAVLVPDQARPRALMTLKDHRAEWPVVGPVSQMVLSAVHPETPGWYPKLVSEGLMHFRSLGTEHVTLTTQAANRPVIRVWENAGFSFGQAHLVLRKVLE